MTIGNDNFLISKKVREFIIFNNKLICNIPKKDYIYRNEYRSILTKMLYNIYLANNGNEKIKYLIKIKSYISMVDFYLELFYKLKYISEKELRLNVYKLTEIYKMSVSWLEKYNEN